VKNITNVLNEDSKAIAHVRQSAKYNSHRVAVRIIFIRQIGRI
jgi:hypothetical protein